MNKLIDVNRKQYSKLLALERKELALQKQQSDTWVKYVYLLLEYTMTQCQEKNVLFYNLDEFGQTMVLRNAANDLRKLVKLPEYEVIYDPLDASVIVEKLANEDIGRRYNLNKEANELLVSLNDKYGELLKSVAVSCLTLIYSICL